jgi:hypothetical protein
LSVIVSFGASEPVVLVGIIQDRLAVFNLTSAHSA